jgi:hypothetical protein
MTNTQFQYYDKCIPSSTTNLRQRKLDTPHLTLVAQAVFADDLEFGIAVMRLGNRRLEQRQAAAQWPCVMSRTDVPTRTVVEGPCRFWSSCDCCEVSNTPKEKVKTSEMVQLLDVQDARLGCSGVALEVEW